MKYIKLVNCLILLIMFCPSCFDVLNSLQTHIVGHISVIDSNDQAGGHYNIVIENKEGNNDVIFYDYVVDLYGDDSKLLIKCLDHQTCKNVFYTLDHNKGHQPIKLDKIDSAAFTSAISSLDKLYIFHTDHVKCP